MITCNPKYSQILHVNFHFYIVNMLISAPIIMKSLSVLFNTSDSKKNKMNKGRLRYRAIKSCRWQARMYIYTQISMNFLLLMFVDYLCYFIKAALWDKARIFRRNILISKRKGGGEALPCSSAIHSKILFKKALLPCGK